MIITISGKCSSFGGPDDHGVLPNEGLAIYDQSDIESGWRYKNPHDLFLIEQPKGTSGTARRLNPDKFYIACRWDYRQTSRSFLQKTQVIVKSPKTGKSFLAWPTDWGPNESTRRIADLSPGLMKALGINTDDEVEVTIPMPEQNDSFQKYMMMWG